MLAAAHDEQTAGGQTSLHHGEGIDQAVQALGCKKLPRIAYQRRIRGNAVGASQVRGGLRRGLLSEVGPVIDQPYPAMADKPPNRAAAASDTAMMREQSAGASRSKRPPLSATRA